MEKLYAFGIFDMLGLFVAYVFVISLRLYPRLYHRKYARHFRHDYAPRVSMFIPCKGVDEQFEGNLRAFLRNHYPKARLFFIVENQRDAAYPMLRKYLKNAANAHLVVAGLAKTCGQKNHNLLQGIKASEERADVYLFLDALTTLSTQQFCDLIRPLSHPKITAAVGFRWNILRKKTFGERLHAFMIGMQYSAMNCMFVNAVWGGATAIRREDFEKMGVRECWAKTVVDDMTLQRMIQRQRRRAVFVPTCVKETPHAIDTVRGALVWFTRQMLYVKYYLRPSWLALLALFAYAAANLLALPILATFALLVPGKKVALFVGMKAAFALALMLCCRLLKRPTDDHHRGLSWGLLSPVYIVLMAWASLLTLFTNVMRWRGIAYHLHRDGTVKKIVRHAE